MCVNVCMLACAYRGAGGTRSIKAQGKYCLKQCMFKGCVTVSYVLNFLFSQSSTRGGASNKDGDSKSDGTWQISTAGGQTQLNFTD